MDAAHFFRIVGWVCIVLALYWNDERSILVFIMGLLAHVAALMVDWSHPPKDKIDRFEPPDGPDGYA